MNGKKIAMLGVGSGFVVSVAREMVVSEAMRDWTFALVDIDPERLRRGAAAVRRCFADHGSGISVETYEDRRPALDGAAYVITSCEIRRVPFWIQDIEIPERHGVYQLQGENGGPGGVIHALRNMGMFSGILDDMQALCPHAWLMNFTNPMSYLCTYFKNRSPVRALGFCHQVHGSFGVIAEQLGMEPGELEVITGGVNHFNWLMDIRRRGTGESCMQEFLAGVRASKYWRGAFESVPRQEFTLEVLNTFGAYPVGYDDHIAEYLPFFYEHAEWEAHGIVSRKEALREQLAGGDRGNVLEAMQLQGSWVNRPPFPKDNRHPYYAEKPCQVIEALETNTPTYVDAINIVNHGAIGNLPADAVVDIPAVAVGGEVRGIRVGELPIGAMELCRRQVTLHEMVARAALEGDESLVLQALCLDPYVRSITQARNIWADYRKAYREYLPMFE